MLAQDPRLVRPLAQMRSSSPLPSNQWIAVGDRVQCDTDGRREAVGPVRVSVTYPVSPPRRAPSPPKCHSRSAERRRDFRYQLLAFPRKRANGRQPAQPLFNVWMSSAHHLKTRVVRHTNVGGCSLRRTYRGDCRCSSAADSRRGLCAHQGADRVETGGILVGHLCVDGSIPEIAVHVTALIPARYAAGEVGKLTFTAETWRRCRRPWPCGGVMKSWWVAPFHPAFAWCEKSAQCPSERSRGCALMQSFFSMDDVFLHETVFRRPTTSRWS